MQTSELLIELVDNHYGIYIPQTFVERYKNEIINHAELIESLGDCLEGPDNENYWESWEDICNNAKVKLNNAVYTIYQNDDLWAIAEGYYLNENNELVNSKTEEIIKL